MIDFSIYIQALVPILLRIPLIIMDVGFALSGDPCLHIVYLIVLETYLILHIFLLSILGFVQYQFPEQDTVILGVRALCILWNLFGANAFWSIGHICDTPCYTYFCLSFVFYILMAIAFFGNEICRKPHSVIATEN